MRLKTAGVANSVDPDQMPQFVASDLGLHCLSVPMPRVNMIQTIPKTVNVLIRLFN